MMARLTYLRTQIQLSRPYTLRPVIGQVSVPQTLYYRLYGSHEILTHFDKNMVTGLDGVTNKKLLSWRRPAAPYWNCVTLRRRNL
jgi:hypothetical protein